MAMGVSSIIIMCMQGHRFKKVKVAAWDDVTQEELKLLNELKVVEIGEGDELTKGGFILLGLLRMGQEVGVMKYLADAFEAIEERGGVIIREAEDDNKDDGNAYYSKQAQAYMCGCSKDEVDEMQDFTSIASHVSEANSETTVSSTADTSSYKTPPRRANNDRAWSVSVGVDHTSSPRLFSGLSAILAGGSDDEDDKALTSTETDRKQNTSGSTMSTSDKIKAKDSLGI